MHQHTAQRLLWESSRGKRVIAITMNATQSSTSLDAMVTALEGLACFLPKGARVIRSIGNPRIEHPSGGAVTLRTHRQGTRGLTADILYLDEAVHDTLTPEALNEMMPSLATSPHHELIIA
jgi:hypothetical protein